MRHPWILCLSLTLSLLSACDDAECEDDEIAVGSGCRAKPRAGRDAAAGFEGKVDAAILSDASGGPAAETRRDAGADARLMMEEAYAATADASEISPDAHSAEPDAGDASSQPVHDAGHDEPEANCLHDADGDGFGVPPSTAKCPLTGSPPAAGDCNDGSANASPNGTEQCGDEIDNDCDGKIDEGTPEQCNGVDDDCNPATPDGQGSCGDFACSNGKCLTTCATKQDCGANLFCLSGSCEQDNDGASCTTKEQCVSGGCWDQVCALTQGKACTKNIECASNTCVKICLFHKSNLYELCDENADCNPALQCVTDQCKTIDEAPCKEDKACASGRCVADFCWFIPSDVNGRCDETADCRGGLLCDAPTKKCKAAQGGQCSNTGWCYPPMICTNQVCT
jgi:hypothetical protein